jgi:hypothetical protein
MRGLTSTVVAAIVLAGLVGYIYFVDAERPAAGAEEKAKAFSAIEAEKIEELRITPAGGETARLVKSASGWELVEPVKADADAAEVTSITSNLSSLEVQRVVEDTPGDLAQYGLNPPRVDVAFRLQGDKDFRHLLIGEKTPTGGDLYAKLQNENRVFLVSSYLDTSFNRTPFDLRDKRVLKFDRDKADSLELAGTGSTLRLTKKGEEWWITQPVTARGDFGAIEALVTRLGSVQMQRVVEAEPKDLKEYGLARPAITATVGAGSSRATLALGAVEGGVVYAKDASRPMVVALEEGLATELKKTAADLRRKDVFDFRPFNATRIEISRGGQKTAFEKTKDKDGKESWRTAAGQDADTTKVEDVLNRFSNLRASSFEQARPAALAAPEVTVTVTSGEGKTETVHFARAGGNVFANRPDEPGYAAIESTPYQDAIKALDALSS